MRMTHQAVIIRIAPPNPTRQRVLKHMFINVRNGK